MSGTCIVTGASRGIGRAVALEAARAGFAVAVGFASRRDAADEVVAAIRANGGRAEAYACDVGKEADIQALFEAAARLGPLRALVANAGIGHVGVCAKFDAQSLDRLFSVNVVGTMLCCREAIRRMGRRKGGSGGAIVAMSSFAATTGGRGGVTAYAASKAAVDLFVTGLAREVAGEGIRVNAVRPGITRTDMTSRVFEDAKARADIDATIPIGRPAEPEDVARAVCFLLSQGASYITGAHLDVSGGGFHFGRPS
ncbi:MAG: SDR family oxidoreductase [Hyphomicrobiaceae bacterium]